MYGSYAYREQCRRDSRRAKIVGFAAFILFIFLLGLAGEEDRKAYESSVGKEVPHSLEQAAMVKNQRGRWKW